MCVDCLDVWYGYWQVLLDSIWLALISYFVFQSFGVCDLLMFCSFVLFVCVFLCLLISKLPYVFCGCCVLCVWNIEVEDF